MVELNKFMASHQIISKQQYLVTREGVPYMVFCLEYVTGGHQTTHEGQGSKSDVWNRLDTAQREIFNRLRDFRNQLAEQEHVKPFVVFTNDQLGEIILGQVTTMESMRKIKDVGKARMEKYAHRFLPMLIELFSSKETAEKSTSATEEAEHKA